jgi:hypothetical protein
MNGARYTLFVLVVVLLIQPLRAQPPRPIAFQGMLTDTLGKAKPEGAYDLRFRLYDAPVGGAEVWSEQRSVAVIGGMFNVMLGETAPLTGVDFSTPNWLGIQVGADPEMVPRIRLSASGYSYQAGSAWKAEVADSLTGGRMPPGTVVRSINGLTDHVKLTGGTNVTVVQSHDTVRIAATGGTPFLLPYNDSVTSAGAAITVKNKGEGIGIYSMATDGNAIQANSTNGTGVTGVTNSKNGVYGYTAGPQGFGVSGRNGDLDVWGFLGGHVAGTEYAAGVYGKSSTGTALTVGVWGESVGAVNFGVLGYAATGGTGVRGVSHDGGVGVEGVAETGGYGVRCYGDFAMTDGFFYANPTSTIWTTNKPATVKINDGTQVKLFTEESAELYFTDYGTGMLKGGRTHVDLEPVFLQTVTVDADHPMMVFVQLEDDCKGVFVTHKTATGFDVVELQAGSSHARFTYRVVCKRRYYEDERLATEEQDVQYNANMLQTVWPEIRSRRIDMKSAPGWIDQNIRR